MNLISAQQKNYYNSAIDNLHDTFARTVIIWKDAERAIISDGQDFNYFYRADAQPSVEEEFTPVSGQYQMRIMWISADKINNEAEQLGIRPTLNGNLCRLKMKEDAYNFLSGYKRIDVDGRTCEIYGFSKPHGIIDNQYLTVFVKEIP